MNTKAAIIGRSNHKKKPDMPMLPIPIKYTILIDFGKLVVYFSIRQAFLEAVDVSIKIIKNEIPTITAVLCSVV